MNESQELTVLKDLLNELGGSCGAVCPGSISLNKYELTWCCWDCGDLFKDNPTYKKRMEERVDYPCPCPAVGEDAIVWVEERIQELMEEKYGREEGD